jgi:hypothetical protein
MVFPPKLNFDITNRDKFLIPAIPENHEKNQEINQTARLRQKRVFYY